MLTGLVLEGASHDAGGPVLAFSQMIFLGVESLKPSSPPEKEKIKSDSTLSASASTSSPVGRSSTLKQTKTVSGRSSKWPVSGGG